MFSVGMKREHGQQWVNNKVVDSKEHLFSRTSAYYSSVQCCTQRFFGHTDTYIYILPKCVELSDTHYYGWGALLKRFFKFRISLLGFKCISYPKVFLQTLFKEHFGVLFGCPY